MPGRYSMNLFSEDRGLGRERRNPPSHRRRFLWHRLSAPSTHGGVAVHHRWEHVARDDRGLATKGHSSGL